MKFDEVFGEDVKNMSTWQLAHNCYFVKEVDGERFAYYRDFDREIPCTELIREIVKNQNIDVSEEFYTDDELLGEVLHDWLWYGTSNIEGIIAMFYQSMWAFAETREAVIKPNLLER